MNPHPHPSPMKANHVRYSMLDVPSSFRGIAFVQSCFGEYLCCHRLSWIALMWRSGTIWAGLGEWGGINFFSKLLILRATSPNLLRFESTYCIIIVWEPMNCLLSTRDLRKQKTAFVAEGCWCQTFWLGWALIHLAATGTWMTGRKKNDEHHTTKSSDSPTVMSSNSSRPLPEIWHWVQTNLGFSSALSPPNLSYGTHGLGQFGASTWRPRRIESLREATFALFPRVWLFWCTRRRQGFCMWVSNLFAHWLPRCQGPRQFFTAHPSSGKAGPCDLESIPCLLRGAGLKSRTAVIGLTFLPIGTDKKLFAFIKLQTNIYFVVLFLLYIYTH